MVAVLSQEVANLGPAAKPFLINRVVRSLDEVDTTVVSNARNFLLALVTRQEPADRALIVKGFLDPRSSDAQFAEFVSMLVASDPILLSSLETGTKLRVRTLLMLNAQTAGVALPYQQLRHPAHVLGLCVAQLGEAFVLAELREFFDWVVAKAPYTPELLPALAHAPDLFGRLFQNYLARAGSSQWGMSNPFAAAVPALDAPLAALTTDEKAFKLLASIMKGAEWNGHGPRALINSSFSTLPALKVKARSFAATNPAGAAAALAEQQVDMEFAEFLSDHLA